MDALRMYGKLIAISMRSRMQYRADFITGMISVLILNGVNILLIGILVGRFTELNGWSLWELVFLYSLWMLSHSIYSLLFWHMSSLEDLIVKGTFDQFLLRPLSPFIQFIGREVQYMGIADAVFGIAAFSLAFSQLELQWGAGTWILLMCTILSGTIIETVLAWMIGCLSFWTVRSSAAFFVWMRFNLLVQQYPIDIFGTWFKVIVTGVLPVAFLNYYPAVLLLGKKDIPGWWAGYLSPAVALVLVLLGSLLWRRAIRAYTSSGN